MGKPFAALLTLLFAKRLAAALELAARSADEVERDMGGADAF